MKLLLSRWDGGGPEIGPPEYYVSVIKNRNKSTIFLALDDIGETNLEPTFKIVDMDEITHFGPTLQTTIKSIFEDPLIFSDSYPLYKFGKNGIEKIDINTFVVDK